MTGCDEQGLSENLSFTTRKRDLSLIGVHSNISYCCYLIADKTYRQLDFSYILEILYVLRDVSKNFDSVMTPSSLLE